MIRRKAAGAEEPAGARRRGLRMLRVAMAGVIVFALAAGGWILVQTVRNPDVRARRPGWLDAGASFDVAYWTPLLVTVLVGAGLVLAVLARARRRLAAGEDLWRSDRIRREPDA